MNLILIPARSGSKRLKNKNVKLLNGKPLIQYTIDAAKNASIPNSKIIVSTDSESIKNVAEDLGVSVPFLRSKINSEDASSTLDVVKEVLSSIDQEVKSIIILQPTSPLRNAKHLEEAFNNFITTQNNIISVTPALFNKYVYYQNEEDTMEKSPENLKSYCINGAIYIIKNDKVNLENYTQKFTPYIMNKYDSIDIDYEKDFLLAEALIKNGGE